MKTVDRNLFLVVAAVLMAGVLNACAGAKSPMSDGGSRVATTIDGGEECSEQVIRNIRYALTCKNGYQQDGTRAADGSVSFADAGLEVGDQCALEIHGDKNGNDAVKYSWLSRPPVEGLYCSSNLATVELVESAAGKKSMALAFELLTVYGIEYIDSFPASLDVEFVLEEGATVPNDKEMLANLVCDKNRKYASTEVAAGSSANLRRFTFNLSASLMKGTSCAQIVIARNNVAVYSGDLSGVKFDNPVKGKAENFAGPFQVKTTEEIIGTAKCIVKDAAGKCLNIELPRSAGNVWFAVVNGEQEAQPVKYVVMPGFGLASDHGNRLDLADMQREIAASSGKFSWYKIDAEAMITAGDYNRDVIMNNIKPHKLTETVLNAKPLTLKNFDSIYLHGFKTVAEGLLNAKPTARWLAKVTAKKDKEQDQFFVGGQQNYFLSTAKAAADRYFTLESLKTDAAKYSVYGFVGSSLKTANCALRPSYFTEDLSAKTVAELSGNPADAGLDACRVAGAGRAADLGNDWTYTVTFFLWSWHKAGF